VPSSWQETFPEGAWKLFEPEEAVEPLSEATELVVTVIVPPGWSSLFCSLSFSLTCLSCLAVRLSTIRSWIVVVVSRRA
jgi:hypothetical protein